jgi:hypothetical protein
MGFSISEGIRSKRPSSPELSHSGLEVASVGKAGQCPAVSQDRVGMPGEMR